MRRKPGYTGAGLLDYRLFQRHHQGLQHTNLGTPSI
jgi:hypothetical protein